MRRITDEGMTLLTRWLVVTGVVGAGIFVATLYWEYYTLGVIVLSLGIIIAVMLMTLIDTEHTLRHQAREEEERTL